MRPYQSDRGAKRSRVHPHYFVEQLRVFGDLLRLRLLLSMTFERNIRAAEGYADLGMYDDALAELDELDPDEQERLETLRMRAEIVLRKRDWRSALRLSLKACQLYPNESSGFIHAAFCLHELGRTQDAKQTLLDGPAKLLDEPVYYYNLGCYDAVLGNLDQAKAYLHASFRLDKSFRDMAKNDPDLERIKDEL
jgi:predicted Zn-dependent protease